MTEEGKKDVEEGEVITLQDILKLFDEQKYPRIPFEITKLIFVCGGCGHRDLMIKFLEREEDLPSWCNEIKNTPIYKQPISNMASYFTCPKCKSAIIMYDKKFAKNNLMNRLKNEKDKDKKP